ncbi:MarR family winged helix-turn-helix transcriptional regulator [Kineococcus sp. GCM10028916]|uniref:MarR family winged helix-turn-helix transcriptional regulator n=1 Tax=Kineococcus sp. GCM10028916 TaxID=3273394 RepID=UPI003634BAD6
MEALMITEPSGVEVLATSTAALPLALPGAQTLHDVVAVSPSSGLELAHLAMQVGLAVGALLDTAAAQVELVTSDLRALYFLDMCGTRTAGELAMQLMVQQSCVTLLAGRLEGKQLLQRHRDPGDRRKVLLQITPAGQDLVRQVAARARYDVRRLFAPLSPAQSAHLAVLLGEIVEARPGSGTGS